MIDFVTDNIMTWVRAHGGAWFVGAMYAIGCGCLFSAASICARDRKVAWDINNRAWIKRKTIEAGEEGWSDIQQLCVVSAKAIGDNTIYLLWLFGGSVASMLLLGWGAWPLSIAVLLGAWVGHKLEMAFTFKFNPLSYLNDPDVVLDKDQTKS